MQEGSKDMPTALFSGGGPPPTAFGFKQEVARHLVLTAREKPYAQAANSLLSTLNEEEAKRTPAPSKQERALRAKAAKLPPPPSPPTTSAKTAKGDSCSADVIDELQKCRREADAARINLAAARQEVKALRLELEEAKAQLVLHK